MKKEFSVNVLYEIISNFEKQGKIFTNEEQLQFELAIALKEKGYNVELEVLSMSQNELSKNDKGEKLYTDIIVNLGDNSYVAIELKHKLMEKKIVYNVNGKNVYAFPQGAHNIGSHDFLKDIERLERMTKLDREDRIPFQFNKENKIIKSFAIIFTNDKNYYTPYKNNNSLNKDYKLVGEKHGYLYSYIAVDENGERINNPTNSQKENIVPIKSKEDCLKYYGKVYDGKLPILLKGSYKCEWKDYNVAKCEFYGIINYPKFKYLLLEIDN